jgi:hypothetical protein
VVGDALLARAAQPVAARLADRRPAAVVLVVGGDVADAGVQAHAVVLLADGVELARQVGRIAQRAQVRPPVLDVAEQRFDVGLIRGGTGAAVVGRDRVQGP